MRAQTLKLLHVEDNPGDAYLLRNDLGRVEGFSARVENAHRLEAALSALPGADFDMVLLDIYLPDSSGIESILRMIEHAGRIPLIVLTGLDDPELERLAIRSGVQEFIVKGSLPAASLVRLIKQSIERHDLQLAMNHSVLQLKEMTAQYRSMIAENADAMIVVDKDSIVLFANRAAEAMFGRPVAEQIDRKLDVPYEGADRTEVDLVGSDGQKIVAEMRVMPALWDGVAGNLVTLRDISERKQHEAALRIAVETAEQASRMKSAFLANMSHELRTPLNSIIGFAEMMCGETYGPVGHPKYREYSDAIGMSGRHLLHLIGDLLDLSKAEAGRLELHETDFDFRDLVVECMAFVALTAQDRGVAIAEEVGSIRVTGDEVKLRQVLLNLLSNAIKFTDPGGKLSVMSKVRSDGALEVVVSDTGIGIPPAALSRVFDVFGQANLDYARNSEGTGLGLPLCRVLVELHGGDIEISSVEGRGTVVLFTLPAERVAVP